MSKITQTRDGFRFEKVGIDWNVYDAASGERLGRVRENGSRLKGRSWTAFGASGETRHSSRRNAAQSLAGRA